MHFRPAGGRNIFWVIFSMSLEVAENGLFGLGEVCLGGFRHFLVGVVGVGKKSDRLLATVL